jgi:hypothetical protein
MMMMMTTILLLLVMITIVMITKDSVSPSGRTSWVPTAWMPSRNEQGNLNEGPDEGDG